MKDEEQEKKDTSATPRRKPARRYRVVIVNENSGRRLWQVKLRGSRIAVAAVAVPAAIASLILVILMFTPLGRLLPGHLRGYQREEVMAAAMRVDSLEALARQSDAYSRNIINILTDSVSPREALAGAEALPSVVDTLIDAGERERAFAARFEQENRYNLSVLSPIAAEGMLFESPSETDTGAGGVNAVYRGTVVGCFTAPDGSQTVIVQHPNDFLSTYANLMQAFVEKGDKVVAGQRLGRTSAALPLDFGLWHNGAALDPALYIPE